MPVVKGRYLESHFFFGRNCRGGVAIYERPDGESRKRCVRIEARFTGQRAITFELDAQDMAEFMAVLRGARSRFIKQIKRSTEPKTLIINYHRDATPPNAWVLYARKGQTSISIGFASETAWRSQVFALHVAQHMAPGVSDACLLQILAGTGRVTPDG